VFVSIAALRAAEPDIEVLATCTPPCTRYDLVREAIAAGKHVLMEKQPTSTISELEDLVAFAEHRGCTLFQAWHSQHNRSVETTRQFLAHQGVRSFHIDWREDVRKWHPGQKWIWQPSGFGVCEPGINAFSILTRVMPYPVFVDRSKLVSSSNRQGPIQAKVVFRSSQFERGEMSADFDWTARSSEFWRLSFRTDDGHELMLDQSGRRLVVDGQPIVNDTTPEYSAIYMRFAEQLESGESEVDSAPSRLLSDLFLKASHELAPAFHW